MMAVVAPVGRTRVRWVMAMKSRGVNDVVRAFG